MSRAFAGVICALALLGGAGLARAADPAPIADRYGPAAAPSPRDAPGAYAPAGLSGRETARAAPVRLLDWPGKAASPATPLAPPSPPAIQAQAPAAYAPRGPVRTNPAPMAVMSPAFAPISAPRGAVPYSAAPQQGTPPQTPPQIPPASAIPARPLATGAPLASAAPMQHARLYSVHRAYGMQPDPAPIPPQFFAQTADLSADMSGPATPEPVPGRSANAAARNAVNTARLAAAQAN